MQNNIPTDEKIVEEIRSSFSRRLDIQRFPLRNRKNLASLIDSDQSSSTKLVSINQLLRFGLVQITFHADGADHMMNHYCSAGWSGLHVVSGPRYTKAEAKEEVCKMILDFFVPVIVSQLNGTHGEATNTDDIDSCLIDLETIATTSMCLGFKTELMMYRAPQFLSAAATNNINIMLNYALPSEKSYRIVMIHEDYFVAVEYLGNVVIPKISKQSIRILHANLNYYKISHHFDELILADHSGIILEPYCFVDCNVYGFMVNNKSRTLPSSFIVLEGGTPLHRVATQLNGSHGEYTCEDDMSSKSPRNETKKAAKVKVPKRPQLKIQAEASPDQSKTQSEMGNKPIKPDDFTKLMPRIDDEFDSVIFCDFVFGVSSMVLEGANDFRLNQRDVFRYVQDKPVAHTYEHFFGWTSKVKRPEEQACFEFLMRICHTDGCYDVVNNFITKLRKTELITVMNGIAKKRPVALADKTDVLCSLDADVETSQLLGNMFAKTTTPDPAPTASESADQCSKTTSTDLCPDQTPKTTPDEYQVEEEFHENNTPMTFEVRDALLCLTVLIQESSSI
jgi:hypothetical protein